MSWNGHFVVVRDTTVADLSRAGWRASGATVSADEASQSDFEGLAAAQFAGGVLLLDPSLGQVGLGPSLAAALATEVVTATFSGVADVYEWRVDGPLAERHRVRSVDDELVDVGHPVPEEAGVDRLDEDSLWRLLAGRTGLPPAWQDLPAEVLVREIPDLAADDRKGFWRRRSRRGD